MFWDQLLDFFLSGLQLGAIFAFIALGYTMVYGIIRLINFAHGEFMMFGAYAGYFCLMNLGIEKLALPEVRYFMDTFAPSFRLTLDELR